MSKQEEIPREIQFPLNLQCSPQAEVSYHCRCGQPRVNFKKRENKNREGEGEREREKKEGEEKGEEGHRRGKSSLLRISPRNPRISEIWNMNQ